MVMRNHGGMWPPRLDDIEPITERILAMAARYVIIDDSTGAEIPQGMPHYEVQYELKNINGIPTGHPSFHFIHYPQALEDVKSHMEMPNFVSVTIRRR